MEQDFVNTAIRKLDAQKEKFKKDKPEGNEFYWSEGSGAPLGAQYKCQIAYYLVSSLRGISLEAFASTIVDQHDRLPLNAIPCRSRGLRAGVGKDSHFDKDTYKTWLTTGKIAPSVDHAESCVECTLHAADIYLIGDCKPDKTIHSVLSEFRGSVRSALKACLDILYYVPGAIDFQYIESRIHGVMPRGTGLGLTSEKDFARNYAAVLDALCEQRSVQVVGPSYSGKHTLLRDVVKEHLKNGFKTSSGARLSMCVLSLHEHPPAEAIALIAAFYRDALGVQRAGSTVSEFIAEIAHLSRQFPALIVLAGLDAIDSNEIVRALHQDFIGEVVSRLLEGHPETRVLVSTSTSGAWTFSAETRPSLAFDRRITLADERIPAGNYEYRALLKCAQSIWCERHGREQQKLEEELGDLWFSDDQLRTIQMRHGALEKLGQFICATLLNDEERCCLGMVALSHDGLKPSTISAIVKSLRGGSIKPERWSFEPVDVLRPLPPQVVRHPNKRPGEAPFCFEIERALRDPILTAWEQVAPEQFRDACWGLARAAAEEARKLRSISGIEASAGRDVQVLIFLLACVSPSEIAHPTDDLPSESVVLPQLIVSNAAKPSPKTIVDFCFSTLFEGDLERTADGGSLTLSDARLRLAAVRPFIDNRHFWMSLASENVSTYWRAEDRYAPWIGIKLGQKLRLLQFAAAAAVRLNLSKVITACVALAQSLTEGQVLDDQDLEMLVRIQLYELDFAILLGHNPDSPAWQLRDAENSNTALRQLEDRAHSLVFSLWPHRNTIAYNAAKQRIVARLGEIFHLQGNHGAAYFAFLEAAGPRGPQARRGSISLHGRSRRKFMRLLVDMARAQLYGPVTVDPVLYQDGLWLPVLHRATERSSRLSQAEQVVAESIRRLTIGSTNDWIGVKIDLARLAALKLHYADAIQILDQARALTKTPSASRDVVLEYLSVEGRILTDAAAFAMAVAAMEPPERRHLYESDLADLSRYIRVSADENAWLDCSHAVAISSELCSLASRTLNGLREMVFLPNRQRTRYTLYADYLDVWLSVVLSRQTIDGTENNVRNAAVRAQLDRAGKKFEAVLASMLESGYMLPLRESKLLYESFAAAGIAILVPKHFPDISPFANRPSLEGQLDLTPE